MDTEIKKLADNKDLKSLKYIFVDSLDVDPTFVRYEEEYNYCKSIPGLLEQHMELTPFTQDKSTWKELYWTNLKMDLVKNFSDKRMMHMREVAKVFLAEKVQRILAERANSSAIPRTEPSKITKDPIIVTPAIDISSRVEITSQPRLSKAEQEARELKEMKERLAKEKKDDEARIEAEKVHIAQMRSQNKNANTASTSGTDSKKILGIALAAVAVIAVLLAILLLK